METKSLFLILASPSFIWLVRPDVYSPWYLENLLASPLVILIAYIILLVLLVNYLKTKIVIYTFMLHLSIIGTLITIDSSLHSSKQCNNRISVFQFNNRYNENDNRKLVSLLMGTNYDLVVLQEISPLARKELINQLSPIYPYFVTGISLAEHIATDQLILSQHPFTKEKYFKHQNNSHLIQMKWHYTNETIHLFTLHPPSPRTKELWKKRNNTLYQLASQIKLLKSESILIVGDFNLSSFSARIKLFTTTLNGSFKGSWPNIQNILPFLTVAIDHVFINSNMMICSRERIDVVNYSDHYPIITHISL